MAHPRRDDQIIKVMAALRCSNFMCVEIDANDLAQDNGGIGLPAQDASYGSRNVTRAQRRGRNLVKKRLKQVVISSIDDRDVHRHAPKSFGHVEPGESGADYYNLRPVQEMIPARIP